MNLGQVKILIEHLATFQTLKQIIQGRSITRIGREILKILLSNLPKKQLKGITKNSCRHLPLLQKIDYLEE
jgi:hypothetical protein